MSNSGKYDANSGKGEILKLYGEKVYSITPNFAGIFIDEKGREIARRVTADLQVDEIYKTQYHANALAYGFQPLTDTTKIIYYNIDGEVNSLQFLPTLDTEYSSIICQVEPSKPLVAVSLVIYTGPSVNKVLLSDGSIKMDNDYFPSNAKDLVTKDYADDLVEDAAASNYPLKSFSIKQGEIAPLLGYSYIDNTPQNILFVRKAKTRERLADCILTVDSFSIPNDFSKENTQIGLYVNGTVNNIVYVKDIFSGEISNWSLIDSTNIYARKVDTFYWSNKFQLIFNLKDFESKLDPTNPYLEIAIKIWDGSKNRLTDKVIYGIDEYITSADSEDSNITYFEENMQRYRTFFVSGIAYFPENYSKIYTLPITLNIKNNFLQYFRSYSNVKLLVLDKDKKETRSYELTLDSHLPLSGNLIYNKQIDFTIEDKFLSFQTFNLFGDLLYEKTIPLDTTTDNSDESNRVTTCSGRIRTPENDYGSPWISTKSLEDWDMKLYNNSYTSENSRNSAVCFVVEPENDCYSHITIDIDHDGEMFILSEGHTGWLNCQKSVVPFTVPKRHEDGCFVNDNYYTFGKVMYQSKVFIRIIRATKVIFHSAVLD